MLSKQRNMEHGAVSGYNSSKTLFSPALAAGEALMEIYLVVPDPFAQRFLPGFAANCLEGRGPVGARPHYHTQESTSDPADLLHFLFVLKISYLIYNKDI